MLTDEGGALAGIISERDIIRAFATRGASIGQLRAEDLMTKQVLTCAPETSLPDVLALMSTNGIRHLPVVRGHELVGLISVRDVLDTQQQLLIADFERRKKDSEALREAHVRLEKAFAEKTADLEHEAALRHSADADLTRNRKDLEFRLHELETSEVRYRHLVEDSQFGIRIEHPGGARLFANETCARMFGYDHASEYLASLGEPGSAGLVKSTVRPDHSTRE